MNATKKIPVTRVSKRPPVNSTTKKLSKKILGILRNHSAKSGELERTLNKDKPAIEAAIEYLRACGYPILYRGVSGMYVLDYAPRKRFRAIPRKILYTDQVIHKVGMSETHLGGRHSQPHFVAILWKMIQSGELGKIDQIDHFGDVFNGLKHPDYNRGGNILNTADLQHEAGIKVFSILQGIPVFIRPGDHDLWQMTASGIDMVKRLVVELNLRRQIEGKNANFYYVGGDDFDQATHRGFVTEYKHIMSAQSRGLTTKVQYMLEDRFGDFVKGLRGDGKKHPHLSQPHHIGCGNWHREVHIFHGGVSIDLFPGFQESTTWERNMGIVHKFGAKVVTIGLDAKGNIFRDDVRYIDLSDDIESISAAEMNEALLNLSLRSFDAHREKK